MQHKTNEKVLVHLLSLYLLVFYFIKNKIICVILCERKLGQIFKEQDEVLNAARMSHFWFLTSLDNKLQ